LPSLGRFLAILFGAACVVAAVSACGSSGDSARNPDDGRNSVVADDVEVVEVPTHWASGNAADIKTLIASTGTVFVGEVRAVSQRTAQIGGELPGGEATGANSGKPGGRQPASFPISTFEITVVRPLAGGLSAGQAVKLEQPGGVTTQTDGGQARIQLEGDEPLEVGRTYLIFASARADGVLTTAPFARFAVGEDGSLASLSEWADLPAARELSGASIDEAASEVLANVR
jgi:hypothetical protein